MISIITAVYNQLPMNRIYLDSLRNSTEGEWELIVIDNGSTDGSAEFFESAPGNIRVIRNNGNYSYPYCQNQGIKVAQGDVLAFLNNDILLSKGWDKRIGMILGKDGYEFLTLSSNDYMLNRHEAKIINRRFKWVKYPLLKLRGATRDSLKLMKVLTYGNFDRFCEKIWKRDGLKTKPGFSGSAVIISRRGLEIMGEWDPTQQGADYDLFFRTVERSRTVGDIKPLSVVGGIYHHHYSRLTFRHKFPPFVDRDNIRLVEDKWDKDKINAYTALMRE